MRLGVTCEWISSVTIALEQIVPDGVGGWRAGGVCGWVERTSPGGIRIRLLDTLAGQTAAALLEEQLLDVRLSTDHPPAVRLGVFD